MRVSYNTATADVNASAQRGNYPHSFGGGFLANFLSMTVTGSAAPYVTIEDLASDTFRFNDGATGTPAGGTMSVNGTPDVNVRVAMAFTDSSGTAFASDGLPQNLAFANPPCTNPINFPHTFSIRDSDGTLLLQMNTLNVVPEPPELALLAPGLSILCGRRRETRPRASAMPAWCNVIRELKLRAGCRISACECRGALAFQGPTGHIETCESKTKSPGVGTG